MFRSLASGWSKLDSFFSIRRVFFIWRCFSLSLSFRLFLFESSHFLAFLLPSVDLLYNQNTARVSPFCFCSFSKEGTRDQREREEGKKPDTFGLKRHEQKKTLTSPFQPPPRLNEKKKHKNRRQGRGQAVHEQPVQAGGHPAQVKRPKVLI